MNVRVERCDEVSWGKSMYSTSGTDEVLSLLSA